MIALFPGRFQPFHRGHLGTIEQILEECKSVIIGLRPQGNDLFTIWQRKEIIAIATIGKPCLVVPLEQVKHYDYVHTGNMDLAGQFPVKKVKLLSRYGNVSGTEIRQRLAQDLDISHLVCDGTEDLIRKYYKN